ncbi:hypothetical protein ElyMa_004282300 [Elysia marginata]|uniref:Uncharacterized protein n=1 Tax=Elysia marginata TaxID=1093978 RepID=A0AAV4GUK4_9GAST|nr:hypothetical protein ElyMa_004282300 [Elysia marginata]
MERAKQRKEDKENILEKSGAMGKTRKEIISGASEENASFLNKALEHDNPSSSPSTEASLRKSSQSGDPNRTKNLKDSNPKCLDQASEPAGKHSTTTTINTTSSSISTSTPCKLAGLSKSCSLGNPVSESTRWRSGMPAWFFVLCSVSLLSLMAVSLAWTYVSYSSALSAMEDRLLKLELAQLDYSDRIEVLVTREVDRRLKDVQHQVWECCINNN